MDLDSEFYKTKKKPSPRGTANFFSVISFWWLRELFQLGWRGPLQSADVYDLPPSYSARTLGEAYQISWDEQLKEEKPSLLKVILKKHWKAVLFIDLFYTISELVLRLSQPICLGLLISYFSQEQSSISEQEAYLCAAGVVLGLLLHVLVLHPSLVALYDIAMKMRQGCCSLMYRKILKIDIHSPLTSGLAGRTVNLLGTDASRFDSFIMLSPELMRGPVEGVLVAYFMYWNMGGAALIGVAFLMCFIPLQVFLGNVTAKLRMLVSGHTDERIRMMSEVIQGIQVIKMYAWELCFTDFIGKARKKEMKIIRKISWIQAFASSCVKLNTKISIFISILAYVLFGNQITATKIFVLYALYDLIKMSVVDLFPLAVMSMLDAFVSVKRIQDFLLLPEVDNLALFGKNDDKVTNYQSNIINIQKVQDLSKDKKGTNKKSKKVELKGGTTQNLDEKSGNGIQNEKLKATNEAEVQKEMKETRKNGVDESEKNILKKAKNKNIVKNLADKDVSYKRSDVDDPNDDIEVCGDDMDEFLDQTFREVDYCFDNNAFDLDYEAHSVKSLEVKEGLVMKNATVYWPDTNSGDGEKMLALDNINLKVQGQLLLLLGPVGCGKSTLLRAALGELACTNSNAVSRGSVSYCPQQPWLFSASLRQNILLGLPYRPERYRRVLRSCQLTQDLHNLPHGDRTIVGERGCVLSGGQRARVCLARCMYRSAGLYLLDDPLSAVDAHVASALSRSWSTARGMLHGSSVLLSTHHMQHARYADLICIMEHGKIVFQGSYEELQLSHSRVIELLPAQPADDADDYILDDDPDPGPKPRTCAASVSSNLSKTTLEDTEDDQVLETQQIGSVRARVYSTYARGAGSLVKTIFLLVLFAVGQASFSVSDIWISEWVNKEESSGLDPYPTNVTYPQPPDLSYPPEEEVLWRLSRNEYVYVYSGLMVLSIVLTLGKLVIFFNMAIRASINLHQALFRGIVRATMWFFNNNSSGRILNRFAKDMGTIDNLLPKSLADCLTFIFETIGILVVVCIVNVWLLIPTAVLVVLLGYIRTVFLSTARSLKRLEGISRSPAFSHVSSTLSGLEVIRADGPRLQRILQQQFDQHQDLHSSVWTLILSTNRAFAYWMDLVCCVYLAVVTFSFLVFFQNGVFGGEVGLAITQVMGLVGMCQSGMRQTADMENNMTSVERVDEYSTLRSEPALETDDKKVRKMYPEVDLETWPKEGRLEFKNLFLKYDDDEATPNILKDLNFCIHPGEKVGVVGRTGAGKSSLVAAIFRLAPTQGSIFLGGVDTQDLGLHQLRNAMSIIPQEPILFSGTIRENLDPQSKYNDEELWRVLQEVQLKEVVGGLGLHSRVTDGGSNMSSGQRQLLCLARAALRNTHFLMLDEATANVDPETDQLIQSTIKSKFEDRTVMTIAHRLHTIMDSDRVMVMADGRMVECGPPYELLTYVPGDLHQGTSRNTSRENAGGSTGTLVTGHFKLLVEEIEETERRALYNIAKQNYNKTQLRKKIN